MIKKQKRHRLHSKQIKKICKSKLVLNLNLTDNIVYCGTRYNELGKVDVLGQLGDKYMCMVVKDDKGSIEWLTKEQIKLPIA